ncbi:MAG: tetratricopeptide repeat protein [Thermodesulfobacteriota bacterium]|nr:tetratricopeptide repeat protein [Thermodesulfobacteriota bacterium]
MRNLYRHACILLLVSFVGLVFPASSLGVIYSFGLHPDKERLVFEFPKAIPVYSLERTGRTGLKLGLPRGFTLDGAASRVDLGGAVLVSKVGAVRGGVEITLKTPSFGYVSFALEERSKIVVDIFRDPLGARWKPRVSKKSRTAAVTTEPLSDEAPKTPPKVVSKAPSAPKEAPAPGGLGPVPAAPEAKVPSPPASLDREPRRKPFYAVPYVFRGRVRQVGPDEAEILTGEKPLDTRPVSQGPVAQRPAPAASEAFPEAVPEAVSEAAPDKTQFAPSDKLPDTYVPRTDLRAVQVHKAPASEPGVPVVRSRVVGPLERGVPEGAPSFEFHGMAPPPPPPSVGVAPETGEPAVPPQKIAKGVLPSLPEAEPSVPAEGAALGEALEKEAAEEGLSEEQIQNFQDILLAAQSAVVSGEYDKALEQLQILLAAQKLPKGMREEVLYSKADVLYSKNRGELSDHFDEINGAYERAMNFNLGSERVASALLRRGVLNLRVGNIPEATAYFNLLRTKYKNDINVPQSYYYWGEYYFDNGMYQEAADQFQYLVQVHPESKFVREASVSLARSLRKLGYDKQAFQIVDFIEKRWPRFYIEYPPLLRLLGDAAFATKRYDKARDDYWTYYNIDPQGDDADIVLARLGDIYVETEKFSAAKGIYEKAATDFPDREGGLVAKMRLAEEGVYDRPTIREMFSIFDKPFSMRPSQIYNEIIEKYPESGLAPLAQLKLAMWHLWNKKHLDALKAVTDFQNKFSGNDLSARSKQVGLKAFDQVVSGLMEDENHAKVVELWNKYPFVGEGWQDLTPETRLSCALSFWKKNKSRQALKLVLPFMREEQMPRLSEMALSLGLGIYVENRDWEKVVDLGRAAEEWNIDHDHQRELRYALALAHENLGEFDRSRSLWLVLGNDRDLDPQQRAYALFFLAQDALDKRELKTAYDRAQDALSLLLGTGKDKVKIRGLLQILMDVAEGTGRHREALQWAQDYDGYLPQDDPGRPAFQYRLAGLYKKMTNVGKWRSLLEDLRDRMPGSLYGRMAASDLQTHTLEQAAREYAPGGL